MSEVTLSVSLPRPDLEIRTISHRLFMSNVSMSKKKKIIGTGTDIESSTIE